MLGLRLVLFFTLILVQLSPALISLVKKKVNFVSIIFLGSFAIFSASRLRTLIFGFETTLPRRELSYLILCHLLVLLGYHLTKQLFPKRNIRRHEWVWIELGTAQTLSLAFVIIAITLFGNRFPELIQILLTLQTVALAVILFSHSQKFLVPWIVIGNIGLSFLVSASLGFGVVVVAYWMVGWFMRPSARLIATIILAIIAMGALQRVKADYRHSMVNHPEFSLLQRYQTLSSLLSARFLPAPSAYQSTTSRTETGIGESLTAGAMRLGDDSLARVVALTPTEVPYWRGKTYSALPYLFIPRLLWQQKPKRQIWHEFGMAYRYLAANDPCTSVTFNVFSEGYLNYGIAGMIVSAFLLGVLSGFAELISQNWNPSGPLAFAFASSVLPFALFTDSTSLISVLGYQYLLVAAISLLVRARTIEWGIHLDRFTWEE